MPQAASLYPELTVADHFAVAARVRPDFDRPAAEARLRRLDITLNALADELSGGQQAQVGLTIALGTRAPVLLLAPITAARATHRVVADGETLDGDRLVGRFPDQEGRPITLVRGSGAGRPATLEEVVLGHLAAGRADACPETAEAAV